MRYLVRSAPTAALSLLAVPSVALAGMPTIKVNDLANLRVQSLSFFLLTFLLSSFFIKLVWNYLRSDFPRLPYLSYGKALGLVTLWGLLFVLVLTMISGARELLTPGAWDKVGFTYRVAGDKTPPVSIPAPEQLVQGVTEKERRQKLDNLRAALWEYRRTHDGRLPAKDTASGIPPEAWQVPGPTGRRYVYLPGLSTGKNGVALAAEPDIFGDDRLLLFTEGNIYRMPAAEAARLLAAGGKP